MPMNTLQNLHLNTCAKEAVATQATTALNKILENLYQKNKPCLLLLSGGSAFDLLTYIDDKNLNDKTTLAVLDERYSTNPNENNFAQFKQNLFYSIAQGKNCNMIDTTVHANETKEQLAQRFQNKLQEWKNNNPSGETVAIVGVGPDGHTSGILPFPENPKRFAELFAKPNQLVVSYDAHSKNPYRYRVTTTITFMRNFIDHAIVYAVGENKRGALTQILADSGSLAATPARIFREMKQVRLFTDITLK